MTETILKMLVEEKVSLWRINNFIHKYVNKDQFEYDQEQGYCSPYYTTSLDAAMSIGADELEGWRLHIYTKGMGLCGNLYDYCLCAILKEGKIFNSAQTSTAPRAICHARIQALAYVRGEW